MEIPKLFLRKPDSHQMGTADHKHRDPRLVGNITPCDLTINQSKNCAQADHTLCDPLPHTVFKNPSLKAIVEFRSFEH